MNRRTSDFFPEAYFRRHDESADRPFHDYQPIEPYLDQPAQESFRGLVSRLVKPAGTLLDLMAGAHSYLPLAVQPTIVVGIGLDAAEMRRNPQLSASLVQDLNRFPLLPFTEEAFEAVFCTCGVQYLVRPIELFSEVNRVLKPGGVFLVCFTNDCYPRKTISIWLATHSRQRRLLVARYFRSSGNWQDVEIDPEIPSPGEKENASLQAIWAARAV